MKGHPILYSAAELAWLEANRLLPIAEYHAGFVNAFRRTDVAAANLHALRKRKGWRTGRTGQFVPGQVAPNKGRKCAPGTGGDHPNARRTQFKKGHRAGRAQQLYKPIGTERITEDGYLERKVHDGLPLQARWQLVQRIEWEKVNGPIPDGHALKCLNGNKLDTSAENWALVSRGVLARLNGGRHKKRLAFDDAAPAVKPAVMALARLEQAAHERRKKTSK